MPKLQEIIGEEAFKALPEDTRNKYKDTDFVNSTEYVPKDKFNQVNDEKNEYKKQVGERDTQITKLKEEFKDTEGLKEKVEKLESDNKTQKESYEKQLSDIAFNNALEKGLSSFNVKDKTLIMALLNKENLKVDGDNIIGLKEQLEPLQKSHEYLFEKTPNGTGSFSTGGKGGEEPTKTTFATELGKQRAETLKAKSLTDFAK